MPSWKSTWLVLLGVGLCFLAPTSGLALTCGGVSPTQAVARTPIIVEGEVVAVTHPGAGREAPLALSVAELRPSAVYKWPGARRRGSIRIGYTSCGSHCPTDWKFAVGTTQLVFAYPPEAVDPAPPDSRRLTDALVAHCTMIEVYRDGKVRDEFRSELEALGPRK
jgi:hypothetical protein